MVSHCERRGTSGDGLRGDWGQRLAAGEVWVHTQPYGPTGGQAQAQLVYALSPERLWPHILDYPRWVEYFPDLVRCEAIAPAPSGQPRLYQVGRKSLLGLDLAVEVQLRVQIFKGHRVFFTQEQGSLRDFHASFVLEPWAQGALVTFTLAAIPQIPVPSLVVEHSLKRELPLNLIHMRQVIGGVP